MNEKALQLVERIAPRVKEYRHQIHQHPELGMHEEKTSALVQRELARMGIPYQTFAGHPGVIGVIEGQCPGPCVALRADMDALPIQETTGLPWTSQIPGVSHACGHDVHTSILLGAAEVLWNIREELHGSIKVLFQPAEECPPTGGMQLLLRDGALENPTVDAGIGLHVTAGIPTGAVGYKVGPMSASSNRFFITIKGRAAHGSAPEHGVDAIVTAAQVVMGLQTVVSRNIRAHDPIVVTIGTIKGGDRANVIPETVYMEGTCRTQSFQITDAVPGMMERIIKGICDSTGCSYEFDFVRGYPPVINDEKVTELVRDALAEAFGEQALIRIPLAGMGGEDFAYLAEKVPSTFLRLGCTPRGVEKAVGAHNGAFNPDEECFVVGVKALVVGALNVMNRLHS